jgi:3-hydroxybutyryl-CoA dehydrogenase
MDVKTIGVIGAGPAGREIARAALLGGYRTILEDVSPGTLEQATAAIEQSLRDDVTRGRLKRDEVDGALARFSTARRVDEVCREADLLFETVPEEMEVKLEIFTIFDKFAKPDAILASSTWLSITEIAAITFRTENCVGMRFVNRAPQKSLLEIVRGADSSDATVAACVEIGRRMGLEAVVLREPPEFAVGRDTDAVSRAKGHAE